jgi:hypothetical protein
LQRYSAVCILARERQLNAVFSDHGDRDSTTDTGDARKFPGQV